jgi:ADP-ribose diphosphatase
MDGRMTDSQVLERGQSFRGRMFEIVTERVRMPNGSIRSLDVLQHPGGAAVVAIDTQGQIVLVRQYRHPLGEWLLEIPAGKLDGEEPETCAHRELEEETGYRAERLIRLGSMIPAPGYSDERIWLFLATSLGEGKQSLETGEVLDVVRMPFEQAVEMARTGEITDAKTVCALFLAAPILEQASPTR